MRLVVTGPVGAGKSTFIRTISEIEAVDTDRQATDEVALMKQKTTVAFDFGRLQFGPEQALHLYGTPGQERFDFMWDILIQKAHAYILLVAANAPLQFRQARLIINFMNQRTNIPMMIGLTHTDSEEAWSIEDIQVLLGYSDEVSCPPTILVNPTQLDSVAQAVIQLAQYAIQGI